MRTKTAIVVAIAGLATITATAALASETITYSYDAKGRVTKVVHSGTVNNGVTIDYTHDKADNRTRVKIAGAP